MRNKQDSIAPEMRTSTSQERERNLASAIAEKQNVYEKFAETPLTLWKVTEAALFLNISPGTLFHWVSQRKLPCIRFGSRCLRFDPEQTKQWAAQHAQPEYSDAKRVK